MTNLTEIVMHQELCESKIVIHKTFREQAQNIAHVGNQELITTTNYCINRYSFKLSSKLLIR